MYVFYKKKTTIFFYISKYTFYPFLFPWCFVTTRGISIFRYVQRTHIFNAHNIVKSVHIYMHLIFRIITVRSIFFIVAQFLRINFDFDEKFHRIPFLPPVFIPSNGRPANLWNIYTVREICISICMRARCDLLPVKVLLDDINMSRALRIFSPVSLYPVSITLLGVRARFLSRSLHSGSIEPGGRCLKHARSKYVTISLKLSAVHWRNAYRTRIVQCQFNQTFPSAFDIRGAAVEPRRTRLDEMEVRK